MSIIDGQIDDNTRAIWTVLSIMLLVIWLSIFIMKKFYFNNKIYGEFPFLESYKNRAGLNYLLLIGASLFFWILVSWNPTIYLGLIGIGILFYGISYVIGGVMPSNK
jgi:hypothetical protein